MVVLIPNHQLGLRRRLDDVPRDAYGAAVPGADSYAPLGQLLPALIREQADGVWAINVDPELWPVRVGDQLSDGQRLWSVQTCQLLTNEIDHEVDHIRTSCLQVTATGTEPGSREFVGR